MLNWTIYLAPYFEENISNAFYNKTFTTREKTGQIGVSLVVYIQYIPNMEGLGFQRVSKF